MKSPEELAVFTKKNGFNFELVSFDEKQRNYNDLCDIYDKKITEATTFYKVQKKKN